MNTVNCLSVMLLITEPNHTFWPQTIFRYWSYPICKFYHKTLTIVHNTVIGALSRLTPSHHSKAKCRKNTCTEQQYIVTSNINDIKIYTCNFTALVNILRHFCNSTELLVSSQLGSNNRTLSF